MQREGVLPAQLVGAFGEKIVEAELLRRGWLPANVNATVANAAKFDIFAQKDERVVPIQVKTCGPKSNAFTLRFSPDENVAANEFTVLVKMGEKREGDQIFVIRSRILRAHIEKFRNDVVEAGLKDIGVWDLWLPDRNSQKSYLKHKFGYGERWTEWLNNFDQLESEPLCISVASPA
jgi:hypothetical protein